MSAPGWYPDGQGGHRYWNGTAWTSPGAAPAGGDMSATRIVVLVLAATLGVPTLLVALVYTAGMLSRAVG